MDQCLWLEHTKSEKTENKARAGNLFHPFGRWVRKLKMW
jgi:hypothetical protein